MSHRALTVPFVALFLVLGMQAAHAACNMVNVGEFPLTISGMRALVTAKVNGTEEPFIVDSGAFYSIVSSQTASRLKLPLSDLPPGQVLNVTGIGGNVDWQIATVKEFTIYGVPVHNVEFIAGGTETGASGVIGENFLGPIGDIEYDFANGILRFWRPKGCGANPLAYWATPGHASSVISIEPTTMHKPLIEGTAYLNGVPLHVVFDTGAARSLVSPQAAARAGVKPGDPDVKNGGVSLGLGPETEKSWVAVFASFKIGDEEIHHTHLQISETVSFTDMLLGFDFFLSHRIYVSGSQNKLYFTYNGGPVFSPATSPRRATADASRAAAASEGPADGGQPRGAPEDAASLGRQSAALLARSDYPQAIAALTRAIEQDPTQARFFFDRAQAYRGSGQLPLARADLDHVLTLEPTAVAALLERSRLHVAAREQSAAIADIEAASHSVPQDDNSRLTIGELYLSTDQPQAAIAQFDLWLASHDQDGFKAIGLYNRCQARAIQGRELDKALSDCNASVHLLSGVNSARALEIRGLVHLRRGELAKSMEDYNEALKLQPGDARALYGRGLAQLRSGATAAGEADLAAARKLRPDIGSPFAKMGLAP